MMSDQSGKEKNRPQEASDNKNVPKEMNESSERSGPLDYEKWSMERLHSEARERKIEGYKTMDRRELIHSIFGSGSG
ncbi:MAG TPA: hypothetical protein VK040_04470 [Balneolaceae bacterium]|nr:hypothetical protein [Balneolaceae bacterium]